MIKVSVLYQNAEDKKFDMGYYCNKHIPMVKQKLGAACKRLEVDQGLGGAQPGSNPAFVRCHGSFGFRLCRGTSKSIRSSCRCHHGRHSELHRYPAAYSAQRSKNVGTTPNANV